MTFCPTHKTVNAYGKDECLRCQGGMMWEQSQTHQTAYFRNHGGTQTDYCIRSQGWSSARYTRDPKKTALRIDVYEGPAEEAKATQYYPPSSVYCLTPTSEEAARKASMPWQPAALAEPATVDCPPGCQGCSVCGRRCDDCQEWGEECTCDVQDGYCLFCDSPCEGGECDPPHLCSKHARCAHCNS